MENDYTFEQIVYQQHGDDMDLFFNTLKEFSDKKYISTASIQRVMKVGYARASVILNRLIEYRFASLQIGAFPSRVLQRQHN